MQLKQLSFGLALASTVAAQSLQDALNSQNASLSVLNNLLQQNPNILNALNSAQNVTLLAPNNDAMNLVINGTQTSYGEKVSNSNYLANLLNYHVLKGAYHSSAFEDKPMFINSLLSNQSYTNVTNGQVVQMQKQNGNVVAYSGLRYYSTVKTADVNYTGGVIHIIDRVLTLPQNDTMTLNNANLTALAGAVKAANMTNSLDGERDVTIFAPDNAAFESISSLLANMSSQDVSKILGYHVVQGRVDYSSMLSNMTVKATDGTDLKITVENGGRDVFVNAARVTVPDVIVGNGVVHVVNQVLNPDNKDQKPDPASSNPPPPAFGNGSGSGSGGNGGNGGNGGGSTPTSGGNGPHPTGTTPASGGNQLKTGALGAAALFGGVALLVTL